MEGIMYISQILVPGRAKQLLTKQFYLVNVNKLAAKKSSDKSIFWMHVIAELFQYSNLSNRLSVSLYTMQSCKKDELELFGETLL